MKKFILFLLWYSFLIQTVSANTIIDPPQVIVFPDIYICEGESIILNETGCGYDAYLWDGGATSQTLEVTTAGTYRVELFVVDFSFFKEFNVFTFPAPFVEITGDDYVCFGESANLSATEGYDFYQWSDSNGEIEGATSPFYVATTSGTYTVKVGDESKCFSEASFDVEVGTEILLTTSSSGACAGSGSAKVVVAGGKPPYTYLWSNGATTALVEDLTAGTYSVVVTDTEGCSAQESVVVENSEYCTRLWITHCGLEFNNLNTGLYLHPAVAGAIRYKWTFVDELGIKYHGWIDGSQTIFNLFNAYNSNGERLTYDEKYEVYIQVEHLDENGNIVLGAPGIACSIILGNPKTQLWVTHCGLEFNNLNTGLYLQPAVFGALRYLWTFTDEEGEEYTGWSTGVLFNLQDAYTSGGIQLHYDEIYTVYMQVEYIDKNGNIALGAPGVSCPITLGNPKTRLWIAHCNQEFNNLNTGLYLHPPVVGALRYKWTFTDELGEEYFGWLSSGVLFNLQNAENDQGQQMPYDEIYTVHLQVEYMNENGDIVLGAPGVSCPISLGEEPSNASGTRVFPSPTSGHPAGTVDQAKYKLIIYPNPVSTGFINLHFKGADPESKISYRISDLRGNLIYKTEQASSNEQLRKERFATGIYSIDARIDGYTVQQKIVIQ